MASRENMTVQDAITNQLQLVSFLIQGGNTRRAAEAALKAAILYAAAGREDEGVTIVRWGLGIDVAVYTAEQFDQCRPTLGDALIEPFREAALLHLDAGRDTQARELLARLVKADPSHASCRLLLADLWLREDNNDEAIAQLWAAAELFDQFDLIEGRMEVLERILGIDPYDLAAMRELAQAQLMTLDYDAAIATLTRLLQIKPSARRGRELLAETLARSARSMSAVAILRSLFTYYERTDRHDWATDLVERAVTWNPADEAYCVAVSRLYSPQRPALAPVADPGSTPLRIVG
jgi:tetratricopeptide (TPR) repeat protein